MKILLLGKNGQVGWELQRSLAPLGEVIALDFDSTGTDAADFARPDAAGRTVRAAAARRHRQCRRAHRGRQGRERARARAHASTPTAPGVLAREAAALGAWLVHYSTDYVFDGSGSRPRDRGRADRPAERLRPHQARRRASAIRASGCRHLILRTSWVYAARGGNFARTMLRLAAEREQLSVIDDQIGAPTGAELLADVTAHALRAALRRPELAGTYHVAAAGETSWHGYARHVIEWARAARPAGARWRRKRSTPIATSAYPTPATRPLNSRLDTRKLRAAFGLTLPPWRPASTACWPKCSAARDT